MGVKDDTIYDILDYDSASQDVNIAYYSQTGQFLTLPNPQALFPFKGGISSTYDRLKFSLEFLGPNVFNVHTVEINNPQVCNLNLMDMRRKGYDGNYRDPYALESILLNGRPVIDIDYHKIFNNFPNDGNSMDIMEVNFKQTRNGANPTQCELRSFAQVLNDK